MSELVNRRAVQHLRNIMFPNLPANIQKLFPLIQDSLVDGVNKVPNIVVGEYQDFGANAATPFIGVTSEGPQEGLVNVLRHLSLSIEIWVGGNAAPNVDGRRIISIIYEYVNRYLQNINWSGNGGDETVSYVQIQRSYEIERSSIMFMPDQKIYHLSNVYRVEAVSKTWY